MADKNEVLTTKLLLKEVVDKNKTALDIVDFYSKVADILEKTEIARGKKTSYRVSSSSTISEKLNTNVFASTH